MEWNKSKKEE